MVRRRRRRNAWSYVVVLALGAAVGAFLWSTVIRSKNQPPPGYRPDVTIEVLNGCGIDGAAGRVASILRRAGYDVARTGRADTYHYSRDIVVVRKGDRQDAQALADILEGAGVVEQRVDASPYDITVIVGQAHPLVSKP